MTLHATLEGRVGPPVSMNRARRMVQNPGFLTDEQRVAQYVARPHELDDLVAVIASSAGQEVNQHVLVMGPRGSGKSTLVQRLAAEVRRSPALSRAFTPVVLGEESYTATSLGELWLEVLTHVEPRAGDPDLHAELAALRRERDDQRLAHLALHRLLGLADRRGTRLMVVVENLDMVLGQQLSEADAWGLRKVLQTEPRVLLVATAVSRIPELSLPQYAFYEAFRVTTLRPLSEDDCARLWADCAGDPADVRLVRAVYLLTGGSPRLVVMLAQVAAGASFRALMDDLTGLLDAHTAYFKAAVEVLPPIERKVFIGLCDLWHPATAAEVADAARCTSAKASALLGRLVERGLVVVAAQERARRYQVAERLFNLWHLLRSGRPDARVRVFVEFLVQFCAPETLVGRMARLAEEHDARPEHAADPRPALYDAGHEEAAIALTVDALARGEAIQSPLDTLDLMVDDDAWPELLQHLADLPPSPGVRAAQMLGAWVTDASGEEYALADALITEAPRLRQPWAIAVEARAERGDVDAALELVDRATATLPDDLALRLELAQTLVWTDADPLLERALALANAATAAPHQADAACRARVRALARLRRPEDAVAALREGLAVAERAQAWGLLLVDVLAVAEPAAVRPLLVGPVGEALAPWTFALDLLEGNAPAAAPEMAELAADLVAAVRGARERLLDPT